MASSIFSLLLSIVLLVFVLPSPSLDFPLYLSPIVIRQWRRKQRLLQGQCHNLSMVSAHKVVSRNGTRCQVRVTTQHKKRWRRPNVKDMLKNIVIRNIHEKSEGGIKKALNMSPWQENKTRSLTYYYHGHRIHIMATLQSSMKLSQWVRCAQLLFCLTERCVYVRISWTGFRSHSLRK